MCRCANVFSLLAAKLLFYLDPGVHVDLPQRVFTFTSQWPDRKASADRRSVQPERLILISELHVSDLAGIIFEFLGRGPSVCTALGIY